MPTSFSANTMADSPTQAPNVCQACKLRKKTCDKVLPSCGFCSARRLPCKYDVDASRQRQRVYHPGKHFVALETETTHEAPTLPGSVAIHAHIAADRPVAEQAHRLMQALDISIGKLQSQYASLCYEWLPIISPPFFERLSRACDASPPADTCMLLLCMWLLVSITELNDRASPSFASGGAKPLYRMIKTMFSQAQLETPASLPLIQAGMLLLQCEYACLQPKVAYITLSTCVGMARVLGCHNNFTRSAIKKRFDDDQVIMGEELNVSWALSMAERYAHGTQHHNRPALLLTSNARMILAEMGSDTQSPLTRFPAVNTPLPPSMQRDGWHTSETDCGTLAQGQTEHTNRYGRQAQATSFLDEVLLMRTMAEKHTTSLISQYSDLDKRIRSFLEFIMAEEMKTRNPLSSAVAICIRYFPKLLVQFFHC